MKAIIVITALLPLLAACDALKDRMGIPDPAKLEAEGKAVGGACRHAGRGLEDCYRLNPDADKPAVYAGWKEMNEYMAKNSMQAVPPEIPAEVPGEHKKAAKDEEAGADHGDAAKKDAGHGDKAAETETKTDAKAEGKDAPATDKKPEAKADSHAKAPAGGH
jgi:hypothetical protein